MSVQQYEVEAASSLVFDATKGMQAGRVFYTIMSDFATISNHFKFDKDSGTPIHVTG